MNLVSTEIYDLLREGETDDIENALLILFANHYLKFKVILDYCMDLDIG